MALEGDNAEKLKVLEELESVAEKAVKLCTGLLQICISYGWLHVIMMAIDLEQVLSTLYLHSDVDSSNIY
jgi:hypothetical protein